MSNSLVDFLAGTVLPRKEKVVGGVAVAACIAVLLSTAYITLIFAAWYALVPLYGPVGACLLIACASIALVPLVLALNWSYQSIRKRQRLREAQRQALTAEAKIAQTEAQIAQLAVTALPLLVRKNPIAAVSVVTGLSYLLTRAQRR
ncbi:hypothetical protein [Rhizobium sp. L1K21]|uniref:hypothetical protein n=1 Tax=Rhizobium sp. L1K21 TaxID=2954933 RepID=UPI002091F9A3|nr:hypothetical protein [Rhizobium sp. L1K21]MCO6184677.1 hypothetical protein [Rhizobium sp. L1K21]